MDIELTTQTLTFESFRTCEDVKCPMNAVCVEARPAKCVCAKTIMLCRPDLALGKTRLKLQVGFYVAYIDMEGKLFY